MPKHLQCILIVFACFAGVTVIITVISRVHFKRSLMATLSEIYLRATNRHPSENKERENILRQVQKTGGNYSIPKNIKFCVPVAESNFKGMQVYLINPEGSGGTVIYLHGGGYVHQPLTFHWRFLNKLAKKTDAQIFVPIHPKAPVKTFEYSYRLLTDFYLHVLSGAKSTGRKITVMGDSSGGGLCLGLCRQFVTDGIEIPQDIILLAPWVDISMTNPEIQKYVKKDPRLNLEPARVWAEMWSGGKDLKDERLSPLYGSFTGLNNITVFIGTRDILYPDNMLLKEKLERAGVCPVFYIGENQNHVYPVYPTPEGRKAVNVISGIILRKAVPAATYNTKSA